MQDVAAALPYENTVHETLGVRAVKATPQKVVLELDVTPKVHQLTGILHGGISATLAESAASIGAWLNCDQNKESVVGTDLNISHLKALSDGIVRATATPIRVGRSVQVWGIDISSDDGQPVAIARLTVAVRPVP